MEKIDRELLIKEISTRLPYGIKVQVFGWDEEKGEVAVPLKVYSINTDGYISLEYNHYNVESVYIEDCLLYLRPMSSMTEEEYQICNVFKSDIMTQGYGAIEIYVTRFTNWLDKKHFDWRRTGNNKTLIEAGLALEAPEDMYNIKEK